MKEIRFFLSDDFGLLFFFFFFGGGGGGGVGEGCKIFNIFK